MENFDVIDLSDDELKRMLAKHGYEAGPIVKSTRKIYEKKLIKLLQEKNQSTENSSVIPIKTPSPRKNDDNSDLNERRQVSNKGNIGLFSSPKPSAPSLPQFQPSKPISPPVAKPPPQKYVSDKSYREIENDRMEGEEEFRYVPQKSFGQPSKVYDEDTTEVRQRYSGLSSTPFGAGSGSGSTSYGTTTPFGSTSTTTKFGPGTGSTPLYSQQTNLPGHSLRPWLSKPAESLTAPSRTSDWSTTVSNRNPASSRDIYGSSKGVVVEDDEKNKILSGVPNWAKFGFAFIVCCIFSWFVFQRLMNAEFKPNGALD